MVPILASVNVHVGGSRTWRIQGLRCFSSRTHIRRGLGVSMYLADACSSTGLAEATQGPHERLKQSTSEAGLGAGSRIHVARQGRGAARRDCNGLTQAGRRGSENVAGRQSRMGSRDPSDPGRACRRRRHSVEKHGAATAMVARKAKLAKELEGVGAMALSNELLLLDADRGSQGTELEEDCTPAVED